MENPEQIEQEEKLPPQPSPKRKYILIAAIIAVIVGVGILVLLMQKEAPPQAPEVTSPDTITKVETADWQTYRNEEFGFEVKYPQGWYVNRDYEVVPGGDLKVTVVSSIDKSNYVKGLALDGVPPRGHADIVFAQVEEFVFEDGHRNTIDLGTDVNGNDVVVIQQWRRLEDPLGKKKVHASMGYWSDEPKAQEFDSIFSEVLSTFRFVEPIDTSDWQTYRSEELGFEVKHPSMLEFYKSPTESGFSYEWGEQQGDLLSLAYGAHGSPYQFSFTVYSNPEDLSNEGFMRNIMGRSFVVGDYDSRVKRVEDFTSEDETISGEMFFIEGGVTRVAIFVLIQRDDSIVQIRGDGKTTDQVFLDTFDQILSTFRFTE